ncbi:hypothetical protein [Streptomyces viridosporus]|uniref:hypothetical protein n=1 Tax=Streptomyces viridosporus TaxID=67581 RepID=UPI0009BF7549|nr:hypothetical protein [Streptomyces viridosporus]
MSNFQAGYVAGVEATAVVVATLEASGKTPEEIAAGIAELARRLREEYDREGTITTGITPDAL